MRKEILDCRFLHYALLVVSFAAASAGGLILLGCFSEQAKDVTVVDSTQRGDDGGVRFLASETKTEARVNLSATSHGEPVKWKIGSYNEADAKIPDPSKSNEVVVLFPEDRTAKEVKFEGTFEKNGRQWSVYTIVHVAVEN